MILPRAQRIPVPRGVVENYAGVRVREGTDMRCHLAGTTGFALVIAMSAAGPAAAQTVRFDVTPGLWEMTTTMSGAGQQALMDERLAQIPPAQRPQMEAMMKSALAAMSQPHRMQQCLTEQRIRDGMSLDAHRAAGCMRTVATNTPTELQMHEVCNGGARTSDYHFQTAGPTAMQGHAVTTMTHGGQSSTMTVDIAGKWLGADCGGVSPDRPKME
jgi:hypothetical protein